MGEDKFAEWWEHVHHKRGKEAARRAYRNAVKRLAKEHDDPHAYLLDRMELFAASPDATPTHRSPIHPSTWLNKGHYDDDPATWNLAPHVGPGQRYTSSDSQHVRRGF